MENLIGLSIIIAALIFAGLLAKYYHFRRHTSSDSDEPYYTLVMDDKISTTTDATTEIITNNKVHKTPVETNDINFKDTKYKKDENPLTNEIAVKERVSQAPNRAINSIVFLIIVTRALIKIYRQQDK